MIAPETALFNLLQEKFIFPPEMCSFLKGLFPDIIWRKRLNEKSDVGVKGTKPRR
jgi:hypothetical protein